MRRVVLAVLLVTGSLAGCIDGDEPKVQVTQPELESGRLLTYEITADGETSQETFMVLRGGQGFDLLAWNLSRPDFQSPLLKLDEDLLPRSPNWTRILDYPLQPGDTTRGMVGGSAVELTWEATSHDGPLETDQALRAEALTDDGESIGHIELAAGETPVLTSVSVDSADGTNETWRLVDTRIVDDWNRPPTWSLGDWWTYEGEFRNHEGESQVVYTGNKTQRGAKITNLNPRQVEDRVLMLPFQQWRETDMAPQSGFVTSLASSFWNWPLSHGKTWSGTTTTNDGSESYRAQAHLVDRMRLPDGTVTVGFDVRASVQGAEQPFATYEFSPRVGHLVSWSMAQVGSGDLDLNFTLQDWGHEFHGDIEVPQRVTVAKIPPGNRSTLNGPAEAEETFEVPDQANRLQVGSRSFAVHSSDTQPEFSLELVNPNGTVRYERNETGFEEQRLTLAGVIDATPGTWTWRAALGEDVSMIATIYANWFQTRTFDFR